MATIHHTRSLDGVRAMAILLVMLFHAELVASGWIGVQLFFVLSGFLITSILLKEKGKENSLSIKLKTFWGRRALRIFPLYFGYLLVLGLVYAISHFPASYLTFIPYLLTYSLNYCVTQPFWRIAPMFSPMWSLCVEEQFYLIFPLFLFLVSPKWIGRIMVAVIVLSPLMRYGLELHYLAGGHSNYVVGQAVYWNGLSHLDAFFLGGIIPVLSLDNRVRRPGIWVAILIGLTAIALAWTGLPCGSLDHGEPAWIYTLVNALFASLILALISVHPTPGKGPIKKFFESEILVKIGKVSYGMYMFHTGIQVYVFDRFFPGHSTKVGWLLFIPYVLMVYGLSAVSYRWYESRFIRLKDVFFSTRPTGELTGKPDGPGPIAVPMTNLLPHADASQI